MLYLKTIQKNKQRKKKSQSLLESPVDVPILCFPSL